MDNIKLKLQFDVKYQALKTVFYHISKHPEVHQNVICDNLELA